MTNKKTIDEKSLNADLACASDKEFHVTNNELIERQPLS